MNRDIAGKGASEAVMLIEKPETPVEVRRKWQRIVNLMADPVVIVDGKGNFLAVNDRVEEATGFSKQELLGKNFLKTNVVTAKSKAILVKNLAKKMMGMNVEPYEIEVLTKDGEKLPFEVNAKKIQYEGKPADLVVFRDITQRKRAEEELRKSLKRAHDASTRNEKSSPPPPSPV